MDFWVRVNAEGYYIRWFMVCKGIYFKFNVYDVKGFVMWIFVSYLNSESSKNCLSGEEWPPSMCTPTLSLVYVWLLPTRTQFFYLKVLCQCKSLYPNVYPNLLIKTKTTFMQDFRAAARFTSTADQFLRVKGTTSYNYFFKVTVSWKKHTNTQYCRCIR